MSVWKTIGIVGFEIAILVVLCLAFALPLYYLWNWLLPELFNFPEITYWQSFGLFFLWELFIKFDPVRILLTTAKESKGA